MMTSIQFLILAAFLVCNVFAQRRDVNTVYAEEEVPQRRSNSILSDIAHELIRRSSSSSQVKF